jgi:hypothetical protein
VAPVLELQVEQAGRKLLGWLVPPSASGTAWSIVVA